MDKEDLENATRNYWGFLENNISELDSVLHCYICNAFKELDGKSLLEAELAWARKEKHITSNSCDTLILLVGLSLEPILQSICVHDPNKIMLLLNEEGYPQEEWQDFAKHVSTAVVLLKKKGLINNESRFLGEDVRMSGYSIEGKPASVFKTLVKNLHGENDVVIDVTGGKKSMVTGAFLYAAYTGSRISYVDFEEYDEKKRRPYGFGCKIGELSNPYKEFALREWEQVCTLYERYQFRDAQSLLIGDDGTSKPGSVMAVMQEYLPDSQTAIRLLIKVLRCYEDWDAGLYNEAAEKARDIKKEINFEPPSAVKCLDGKWVVINQASFEKVPFDFYEDTLEFKSYVYDELARIRRLIKYNRDYRSAFLRAASLNEALMLARLVRLLGEEPKKEKIVEILQDHTPPAKSVFRNLAGAKGSSFHIAFNRDNDRIIINGAPEITIEIKNQMEWWKKLSLFDGHGNWEQIIDRRNDLTHQYYSPPRKWAEDAVMFVSANVEEFWGQPIGSQNLQTTELPWSKLVQICGLSVYLPPNLMKEI